MTRSNKLLSVFLAEAAELLAEVDENLFRLERNPADLEPVNEVFQAAHTIRGSASLFDFPDLIRLTHAAERLLGQVRSGELGLTAELTAHLLVAFDQVSRYLAVVTETGQPPVDAASSSAGVIERLEASLVGPAPAAGYRTVTADAWLVLAASLAAVEAVAQLALARSATDGEPAAAPVAEQLVAVARSASAAAALLGLNAHGLDEAAEQGRTEGIRAVLADLLEQRMIEPEPWDGPAIGLPRGHPAGGDEDTRSRVGGGLPTSTALTRVMVVSVAGQRLGVPVDAVVELAQVPRDSINHEPDRDVLVRDGQVITVIDLAVALQLGGRPESDANLLVVRTGRGQLALIVEQFHREVEVTAQPLVGVLAEVRQFAGTALLGDGLVLFVLNVEELAGPD